MKSIESQNLLRSIHYHHLGYNNENTIAVEGNIFSWSLGSYKTHK